MLFYNAVDLCVSFICIVSIVSICLVLILYEYFWKLVKFGC